VLRALLSESVHLGVRQTKQAQQSMGHVKRHDGHEPVCNLALAVMQLEHQDALYSCDSTSERSMSQHTVAVYVS
jgi:hypothetical protein